MPVAFSQRGRGRTLPINNLLEYSHGGLFIAPFEIDSTQVFPGNNAVLVKVHRPGDMSLNILSIHPQLFQQGINFFHLVKTHHRISTKSGRIAVPELTSEGAMVCIFKIRLEAGRGATRTAVRPYPVAQLMGQEVAFIGDTAPRKNGRF